MLQHKNTIWGGKCSCGEDCFILQDKYHPWMKTDYSVELTCPKCKNEVVIDQEKAATYYNDKILSYYQHVTGNVIDLGCGGGFLSSYLLQNYGVEKIFACDIDPSVEAYVNGLSPSRIKFINDDASEVSKYFKKDSVDYLVHRDVFMFIENTDKYFNDVTKIVSKGLVHMAWFMSNNERMKNQMLPEQIKQELEKRGWVVSLEYLEWYRCGYVIIANKN